jgi:hypothetical protein
MCLLRSTVFLRVRTPDPVSISADQPLSSPETIHRCIIAEDAIEDSSAAHGILAPTFAILEPSPVGFTLAVGVYLLISAHLEHIPSDLVPILCDPAQSLGTPSAGICAPG